MSSQHLLVSSKDGIATLTINQPQTLNSLSPAMLNELAEQVAELQADSAVKVVIITGAGTKAFVAGGDIAAMQPLGPLEAREVVHKAQQLFNDIEFGKKIFIAAINGYALGAGCELALACDIRIAPKALSWDNRKSSWESFQAGAEPNGCRGWWVKARRKN